jgi:hypothetical protein
MPSQMLSRVSTISRGTAQTPDRPVRPAPRTRCPDHGCHRFGAPLSTSLPGRRRRMRGLSSLMPAAVTSSDHPRPCTVAAPANVVGGTALLLAAPANTVEGTTLFL